MQDPRSVESRPSPASPSWKVLMAIAATVLIAGGGTAWWAVQQALNSPESTLTTPNPDATPATNPAESAAAEAYYLNVVGDRFELVPVPVEVDSPDREDPVVLLTASFEQMLAGESGSSAFSEIPVGTELLGLTVEPDGVHVNLSDSFTQGGGSASMQGRLGQVIFTASSLDPAVPVWVSVSGEPLEVLGGEGLWVDQPMTREDFNENFSL